MRKEPRPQGVRGLHPLQDWQDKGPLAKEPFVLNWNYGLGDNTVTRDEILASGDRLMPMM
jgi:hypothetical protein